LERGEGDKEGGGGRRVREKGGIERRRMRIVGEGGEGQGKKGETRKVKEGKSRGRGR
jgi:hypothetical protein